MAQIITMPRLSDTMTEGVVATWLKKVGDTIKTGDILAEIETDKATMEFESFHDGVLLHIGIQEGQSAPVDSLLAIIGSAGEDISALLNGETATETKEEKVVEEAKPTSAAVEIPAGVKVVTMPRLSDTMTTGTVATWLKKVGDTVKEGDIFQVNLSQRFGAEIGKDESIELYRILRAINPSPFASLVHLNDFKLISQSPERLVRLKDGIADTRPIAGTRRLVKGNEVRNEELAMELKNDPKECAEHVMLVDLERNDIGKIAEFGTVEVDEFMIIERYSHVMHLVSNVKGKLKKDLDAFDLLKAMFPGGTITGAPKIRSMEIIEELEPTRRGFYTGSLGFVGYNGDMDFNIIIRSFIEKENKVHFQVGAGIVYDSIPEREYKETINKGRAMILAYHNFMKR